MDLKFQHMDRKVLPMEGDDDDNIFGQCFFYLLYIILVPPTPSISQIWLSIVFDGHAVLA